jgi:predicted acylesterase/phospholipase RssA
MVSPTDLDLQEYGLDEDTDASGTPAGYGNETRLVNALRARSLWLRGSVRLLSDLIELTNDDVPGLESDRRLILHASLGSPALLRSLSFKPYGRMRRTAGARMWMPHRIWFTQAKKLGAQLEPLAHILAHAITEQFGEPTSVITFAGSTLHVIRRTGGKDQPVRRSASKRFKSGKEFRADKTSPPFSHQLFVAPGDLSPEKALGELYGRLHRIVYLAKTSPSEMPAYLFPLLYPAVRRRIRTFTKSGGKAHITWSAEDEGPFFSSFVVSLIEKPPHQRFSTEAVDEEFDETGPPDRHPGWRIGRDHCRVYFELQAVENAWRCDKSKPDDEFTRLLKDPNLQRISHRWARGVTNRNVGIALSGGGASSYAFVPLIRALQERRVPIDVVSGVSGGAFLGAYHCKDELQGLQRSIDAGWLYQLGLLPNMLVSEIGRQIVDTTLGSTLMGETDVKFVPVTVKLDPDKAPRAHRVVSGTLGEAVQVSGAAPLLFAPVVKQLDGEGASRFADGALAMLIPARILRDQGADLLFACNSLPAPTTSNPLRKLPGGDLLYNLPFAGGAVDLWMSAAYMQGRFSRAVNPDVSGFFEVQAESAPLLKSVLFAAAQAIVDQAARHPKHIQKAQEFQARWIEFATHPETAAEMAETGGKK